MCRMIPSQNTTEWLAWRKDKIGASDAPIIMGVSPFSTPYQLWMQKVGLSEGQKENDPMRQGKQLEYTVRYTFNAMTGLDLQPKVIVNPLYNWHISSLDGWSQDIFAEIKCPGKKDHELALQGIIPDKYHPQIAHQFMDTDRYDAAYYISFCPEHEKPFFFFVVKKGFFSQQYYANLLNKEEEFYKRVINFDPPPMCDRDYQVIDDHHIKSLVTNYRIECEQRRIHEKSEELYRKEIIEACKGQSSICDGLKISKFPRRGAVQYGNIPELKGVQLDDYRKPTTDQWRLSYDGST
jgi:putative phage-type endonuclease